MQSLGLSAANRTVFGDGLALPHTKSIELRVLDLSGNLLTSLRPTANSGQVNIDADADVTRSATLTFRDDTGSFQFTSGSPADGAVYFDNMIQVVYKVRIPALDNLRVDCPVITGPLVKFDRTADEVSVEIQGKEALALNGVPTMTIPKGRNAIAAIRDILEDRCGETRFSFPATTRRLPAALTVGWEDEVRPWVVCEKIAKSIGLHLFFDGPGVCRLRTLPTAPVFTFRTGEGGNITSPVQVTHDKEQLRNRVSVVGSKPSHKATASLADSHPASSWSLRRNGVRTYLTEAIEDTNIGSIAAAKARATAVMARYEALQFGTTFNAVPVPHLDELDLVHVEAGPHISNERLHQASFPLTGGDMSVGYTDLVAAPRRTLRKP